MSDTLVRYLPKDRFSTRFHADGVTVCCLACREVMSASLGDPLTFERIVRFADEHAGCGG